MRCVVVACACEQMDTASIDCRDGGFVQLGVCVCGGGLTSGCKYFPISAVSFYLSLLILIPRPMPASRV